MKRNNAIRIISIPLALSRSDSTFSSVVLICMASGTIYAVFFFSIFSISANGMDTYLHSLI